ncbi:MAG: VWA domain-containing protein [Planctomycetes bacterium]|nr:VWA domain-containing protein [Planctomycetota bacterium]
MISTHAVATLASIGFSQPGWLLAIPLVWALSLWMARGSIGSERGGRRTTSLALRCLVIALLFACLAEPEIRRRAREVAVVALVDVSDSVPAEQQKRSLRFLDESLAERKPDDRFGVITVARDPLVQSLPSGTASHAETGFIGSTDATDLESGVRLARALLPPDAGGRILLMTDGNQNRGEVREAARALSKAGVPIDVVPVEYDRSRTARVESVTAPAWARDGDTINARVHLHAGQPTPGKLRIILNGQAIDLDPDSSATSLPLTLREGDQVYTLPIRLPEGAVHQLQAVFEPDDQSAAVPQLLSAQAAVFTSDRARILMLSETPETSAPLADAFRNENTRIDIRSASEAPTSLTEWASYDAVVLVDQPSYSFSLQQQEDMVRYVNDAGGGLLMIGGPNSFGAGGWIGSPVADALPIQLDPPQKRQLPMGALALIIDSSGSMSSPVQGTDLTQQQIADEAAVLAIRGLSRLDEVTVIAFSGEPEIIIPLTPCRDPDTLARRIRSIGSGGGTNLFPAMDEAAAQLLKSRAGVKHIIILTDGQTMGDPADGIARAARLKRMGITISTVAIGDMSNDTLLANIAKTAEGRNYNVRSENSWAVLPQIFVKEAQTVRRSLIWEGNGFSPKADFLGESLRGISLPLPPITGYVVAAERPGLATVGLRGMEADPILAQWQHGLGRVTTFTSDASSRWNAAWLGWSGFRPFWEQQIKWVTRPSGSANGRIAIEQSDGRSRVLVDLLDANGERVNFAALRGRIAHPSGSSQPTEDVLFRQVGPGRYEATVEAESPGLHLVSVRYEATDASGNKLAGSLRAAIEKRAGSELLRPLPDRTLLEDVAAATGGRAYRLDRTGTDLWSREGVTMPEAVRPIWSHAALALACLFLLDVAVRRVWVDTDRLAKGVRGFFGKAPEVTSGALNALAATKARAAAEIPKASETLSPSAPFAAPISTQSSEPSARPVPVLEFEKPQPKAETKQPGDMMSRLRGAKNRARENTDSD